MFGQGVLEQERISKVLEQKLSRVRPVKVYTLAQPADDQLEYYAQYRLAETYLKPDLYIVSMVWNDFETWGGKIAIEEEIRAELQEKCPLPEFKEHFSPESSSWLQIIRDHTYQTISPIYSNRCYMNEFVKDIVSHENVIFFNFNRFTGPQWCQEGDQQEHIYQGFVLNVYENIIYANGGTVVGIDVEDWNNWESVTEREAHPSKKMHRRGAEILFEEVVYNEKWAFRSESQ